MPSVIRGCLSKRIQATFNILAAPPLHQTIDDLVFLHPLGIAQPHSLANHTKRHLRNAFINCVVFVIDCFLEIGTILRPNMCHGIQPQIVAIPTTTPRHPLRRISDPTTVQIQKPLRHLLVHRSLALTYERSLRFRSSLEWSHHFFPIKPHRPDYHHSTSLITLDFPILRVRAPAHSSFSHTTSVQSALANPSSFVQASPGTTTILRILLHLSTLSLPL
jgi:hypothetical protein